MAAVSWISRHGPGKTTMRTSRHLFVRGPLVHCPGNLTETGYELNPMYLGQHGCRSSGSFRCCSLPLRDTGKVYLFRDEFDTKIVRTLPTKEANIYHFLGRRSEAAGLPRYGRGVFQEEGVRWVMASSRRVWSDLSRCRLGGCGWHARGLCAQGYLRDRAVDKFARVVVNW